MKLTVNRFGMNINKALKYGAKTAGGGREKMEGERELHFIPVTG